MNKDTVHFVAFVGSLRSVSSHRNLQLCDRIFPFGETVESSTVLTSTFPLAAVNLYQNAGLQTQDSGADANVNPRKKFWALQ